MGEADKLRRVSTWRRSAKKTVIYFDQKSVKVTTLGVCLGQGTLFLSILKPAHFRVTYDFQKKHARVIFGMQFER